MAVARVLVLLWADILADYALWALINYLTNVWNLSIAHAAAIPNICSGLAKVISSFIMFLDHFWSNHFLMLLLSTISYAIGLGFLSMSTPPVLSGFTETCSEYKPKCIGQTQKDLFYTGLVLIAVGISGHIVSLFSFLNEQRQRTDGTQNTLEEIQLQSVEAMILIASQSKIGRRLFFMVAVPLIATFALEIIKPWAIRFGVPAICTVVAAILFLSGSCSYKYNKPQWKPGSTVLRVLVASTLKMFQKLPENASQLYEKLQSADRKLPHTRGFRLLDKAAIILQTKSLEEQEENGWRLCTVTEVEETKVLIRLIPFFIALILYGVISSLGNTFFVAQGNNMNYKVGKLKLPEVTFLAIYHIFVSLTNIFGKNIYKEIRKEDSELKEYPLLATVMPVVYSALCCITAAKVETRRRHAIISHGLLDKPDQTIPMSVFWLLPQFILLALHDGILESTIIGIIRDQTPPSMKKYLLSFCQGIYGLGMILNVLLVYAVGRISEAGAKPSWFQHTLNKSRLDNYYWTLATMSAVNYLWLLFFGAIYIFKKPVVEDNLGSTGNGA